ncbi:MAG: DHA2 family efflux MFS transporter permease subunit [Ilumatobacter sp.]|nr:DHA2 family efflux MFS transporter permease subunit [Ilumatobacter sp.]
MADTLSEIPLHERPEIHARRWFLLGVMCLSLVMVVMAVSGLNVAIPSLQRDLDASATDLQWIVDSYAIVFAGLLLSAGAIGDRFGRKRALMAGLAVFAVGSFIGALADSSTQVIASRAIAGIGAAFVMPATLSLLTAVFPPHERGKAIAVWAGFAGAGGALGPLLVGFLLTGWWIFPSFWWGAVFVVNAVTPLIVLTVVAIYAPRSKDDEATPLDPVGAVLSLIGIAALLFGIIEGPERGWGDAYVVGGFVLGIGLLAGFVLWERHAEHPMLPMQYFRARPFSTGTGIITFGFLVMFGFFFLITQYFQFVKGYTPLRAGVATLPFAFTMIIMSPRSEPLVRRFGLNRVVAGGFTSMATGFVLLGLIRPDTHYLVIACGFVLLAGGMAITLAPATGAIMSSVPLNKAGVGSAVNDTTREFGGALGIAVLGSIVASQYRSHFDTTGLPGELADVAGESVGAAVGVGSQLGGEAGAALIDQAGVAFTDAVNVAFFVSAAIAILTGAVVFLIGRRP